MSAGGSGNNKRTSSSKSTSSYTSHLGQRQAASAKLDAGTKKDELLTKEEEYKRLNAELEKKTANLVYEAEQVLKANEKLLSDTDYLNKVADIDMNSIRPSPVAKHVSINQAAKTKASNLLDFDEISRIRANINREMQENDMEKATGAEKDEETDHLAAYLTTAADDEERASMIPRAANEMSNEAQIRFLKAKLKVMQEELDRSGAELTRKDEENVKLAQRCKDLDEDRAKQLRISNSHQTQLEKLKKINEELQTKLAQTETLAQQAKKESESLKRDLKKAQQEQQQLEIKQNRSAEEVDRLKLELSKQLTNKKDGNEQEKLKLDSLSSENKRLQKQKVELIQAFKKQLKLIDILKKQKMHLEAAKILQFSEQEFINALEWNSNQTAAGGGPANGPKTSGRPQSSTGGSSRNLSYKQNVQGGKKNAPPAVGSGQQKPPLNRSKSDEMSSESKEKFNSANNNNHTANLAIEDNLDYDEDEENYETFHQEYNNNDGDELDVQDYPNYDSDENKVQK